MDTTHSLSEGNLKFNNIYLIHFGMLGNVGDSPDLERCARPGPVKGSQSLVDTVHATAFLKENSRRNEVFSPLFFSENRRVYITSNASVHFIQPRVRRFETMTED